MVPLIPADGLVPHTLSPSKYDRGETWAQSCPIVAVVRRRRVPVHLLRRRFSSSPAGTLLRLRLVRITRIARPSIAFGSSVDLIASGPATPAGVDLAFFSSRERVFSRPIVRKPGLPSELLCNWSMLALLFAIFHTVVLALLILTSADGPQLR